MTNELEQSLIKKYPSLFARIQDRSAPIHYGIQTKDGWYSLISSLCRTIQRHVDSQVEIGSKIIAPSDGKVVELTLEELSERKFYIQPEIIQIKEKWGGLRFYLAGGDGFISGAITLAEDLSFEICETCGSPGKNQMISYCYSTICNDCKEKQNEGAIKRIK